MESDAPSNAAWGKHSTVMTTMFGHMEWPCVHEQCFGKCPNHHIVGHSLRDVLI